MADAACDIQLKDLAALIAKAAGTQVIFDLPNATEAMGFSKATKARLNGDKLKSLGWNLSVSLEEGIRRTLAVLNALS